MIYLIVTFVNFVNVLTGINLVVTSVLFGLAYQFISKYIGTYSVINNISDIGILAMMFDIGSHVDTNQIQKYATIMLFINFVTILCSIICAPVINNFLNIGWAKSFIISICLCLSSTMPCQKILGTKGRMSTDYSQIALLSTIAQDFIGIVCIVYMHMFHEENSNFISIGASHLLLGFLILFTSRFYNRVKNIFVKITNHINLQEYNTLFLLVVLITYYLSDFCLSFGISKEIIFLFAGILLKQIIKDHNEFIISIQNIFLASVFLISGYNMDLISIINSLYKVIAIVIYISFMKFLFYYNTIYFMKKDAETSVMSTLLLTSFSEIIFFIIFLLKLNSEQNTIITVSTIVSIFISPYIFNKFEEIFNQSRIKTFGFARKAARNYIKNIKNYNLIIGLNTLSLCLAQKFGEQIESTVIIDKNWDKIRKYKGDNFIYLDAMTKETYDVLDINKIKHIIICAQKIDIVEKISKLIRNFNQEIGIIYLSHTSQNSVLLVQNRVRTIVIKNDAIEEEVEYLVQELKSN